MNEQKKHSGFVGIVGRPNVGKSTLLNALVGEKLAGVSKKPQTTRDIIRGILSRDEGQAIYLDTPGYHQPKDSVGHWMIKQIQATIHELDLIYMMIVPKFAQAYERQIIDMLSSVKCPVFLLINQIDLHKKSQVLPILDEYQRLFPFKEFIPISAERGDQLDLLIEKTFEYLPESDAFFPEDQISDQNLRFHVSELIREKMYHFTHEEVPYSTVVVIDKFEERDEKLTDIEATIYVERDTQKGIVLGAKGENIKQIGTEARKDIENLIGKKVYLQLWVKQEQDWKSNKSALKRFGFG